MLLFLGDYIYVHPVETICLLHSALLIAERGLKLCGAVSPERLSLDLIHNAGLLLTALTSFMALKVLSARTQWPLVAIKWGARQSVALLLGCSTNRDRGGDVQIIPLTLWSLENRQLASAVVMGTAAFITAE